MTRPGIVVWRSSIPYNVLVTHSFASAYISLSDVVFGKSTKLVNGSLRRTHSCDKSAVPSSDKSNDITAWAYFRRRHVVLFAFVNCIAMAIIFEGLFIPAIASKNVVYVITADPQHSQSEASFRIQ